MKKFNFLCALIFVINLGYGQNKFNYVYYDADTLRYFIVGKTFQLDKDSVLDTVGFIAKVLKQYLNPQPGLDFNTLKANQILRLFQQTGSPNYNPFLAPLIDLSGVQLNLFTEKVGSLGSQALSSIGGLNVTNLVDGLAQFMVERAKQELTTAFFEKFKDQMKSDKFGDLRILFPETYNILMMIDQEIYKFDIYLGSMREAFQHDLANLFANLGLVLNSEKYKPYFAKNPALKAILTSSFYIINSLSKKKHPGDILAGFPLKDWEATGDKNLTGSIETLQLLSSSLRSKSKDHYWIPADSIEQLFIGNDLVTFQIFLGLFYQKADTIKFKNKNLQTLLEPVAENLPALDTYKLFIEDFIDRASLIEEYLNQIIKSKKTDLTYTDYYRYFNAFLDMVEMIKRFDDLPHMNIMNNKTNREFGKYLFIAKRAGDVYLNVNQTNYSSAIINIIPIFDTLFSTSFSLQISQLENILKSIKDLENKIKPGKPFPGDDVDALANLRHDLNKKDALTLTNYINKLNSYKNAGKIDSTLKKKDIKKSFDIVCASVDSSKVKLENFSYTKQLILKYGTFMAGVATAKSSQEVKSVIESSVLPAGSSSIKTYSKFNIAINSYLGAFAGHEWTKGFPSKIVFNSVGVAAPIGIAFSWGLPKSKSVIGAMSVFVSVIDIGALASYRLQNDSVKTIPEITLANIIAPGLYFVFGRLGNSPLAFGIGYQYGPQLRKVTSEGIDKIANASRVTAFLAVDIPFFNVYTKAKEPKFK